MTRTDVAAARQQVAELGRELPAKDLTTGTGGNLSARVDADRLAISPSGVPYDAVGSADVPVVGLDGERVAGDREPSSELPMHAAVYRAREDVGGVVHTHSPYATTFAVLDRPIPASHYLLAAVGGRVPVADYATHATPELGEAAVEALGDDRDACLLRSHGVLAVGGTVTDAFETALTVEFCARVHYQAESVGDPVVLDDGEVATVREKLAAYRRQANR